MESSKPERPRRGNRREKSETKKAQLPTADGSRQSRLDKENAEKEQKNTNVWTKRQQERQRFEPEEDSRKLKERNEELHVSFVIINQYNNFGRVY